MTSSRLTSVAADMRAKAKAATPGPWRYEAAPDGFPPMVIGNDMVVADTFDKPDMPDAAYIAAMHPAVALALADWLDEVRAVHWPKRHDRLTESHYSAEPAHDCIPVDCDETCWAEDYICNGCGTARCRPEITAAALALCDAYEGSVDMRAKGES